MVDINMNEIKIDFIINKHEFVKHGILRLLTDRNRAIILIILLLFIFFTFIKGRQEIAWWLIGIGIIIPFVLVYVLSVFIQVYQISRIHDKTPHLGLTRSMTFSSEGFTSSTSLHNSKLSWENVLKIQKKFDFLEIYVGPKSAIHVPLDAFNKEKFRDFKDLVKENNFIKNNL